MHIKRTKITIKDFHFRRCFLDLRLTTWYFYNYESGLHWTNPTPWQPEIAFPPRSHDGTGLRPNFRNLVFIRGVSQCQTAQRQNCSGSLTQCRIVEFLESLWFWNESSKDCFGFSRYLSFLLIIIQLKWGGALIYQRRRLLCKPFMKLMCLNSLVWTSKFLTV